MPRQLQNINLTPRQLQVLKAIARFKTVRHCSATISELAQSLKLGRTTVFEHIAALRKKALLAGSTGKARCLNPTRLAVRLLEHYRQKDVFQQPANTDGIALLGKVAAGSPIEAIEDRQSISLISEFGNADNIFALQVCGDSMIDEDIRNGDWVICKKSANAHNGQLAIVIVNNENATLKRFYKEENFARLQPANEDYQPIYTNNCRIEAIVIGLMRKF